MGYTHTWSQKRNFTPVEWSQIKQNIQTIIKTAAEQHQQIEIVDLEGAPGTSPELTDEHIFLNGSAPDCWEGMEVYRTLDTSNQEEDFQFCKTNRFPYDTVVVAILCYLNTDYPDAFQMDSDGEPEDLEDGRALAEAALSRSIANPLLKT